MQSMRHWSSFYSSQRCRGTLMTTDISYKTQVPLSSTLQIQRTSQLCRVKMLLVGRRDVKWAGVILSGRKPKSPPQDTFISLHLPEARTSGRYLYTHRFLIKTIGGLKLRKSHIHKVCSKEGKVMNTYLTRHWLNPGPRQWKCRVLTTGLLGNSLFLVNVYSCAAITTILF